MRGPLVPPGVPLARTRSEQFDDLVLDAVEHLEEHWSAELSGVEFAVEEVPPPEPVVDLDALTDPEDAIPLARVFPREGESPARIVLYRRPLEARSTDRGDLADLVHDVVVEQVAELLGIDPDEVEPPEE
jgi:predicted Zn-dependent protease with MMP-like domain